MNDSLLISPVAYEDFIEGYWESQPLHISRKDGNHFSELLSVAGIKNFVSNNAVIFPDVLVVNSSSSIPVANYTNEQRHINADQLFQQHESGGTIIVNEVHRKFAAVGELCAQVNKDYQLRCQANAYLSPPGNQGFHTHYDTHDVFVLQVAGRKTFRFYPSDTELPFPDDTFHPDSIDEDVSEDVSSNKVVEHVELSAGDTLYIPRGIVHDALANEGEPSLHITLGVFPFVARDLLQEMIQVAAERDVSFRRSVELSNTTGVRDVLKNLIEEFNNEENYAEAVSRLADEVAVDCYQALSNSAENMPELSLSPDTVVDVNHSVIHGTEYRDGVLKLRVVGQVIQFSEPLSTPVAKLLKMNSIEIGSLPGLDEQQQFALCHQLASVGAISIRRD